MTNAARVHTIARWTSAAPLVESRPMQVAM